MISWDVTVTNIQYIFQKQPLVAQFQSYQVLKVHGDEPALFTKHVGPVELKNYLLSAYSRGGQLRKGHPWVCLICSCRPNSQLLWYRWYI